MQDSKYSSMYPVMNLGTLFVILNFYAIFLIGFAGCSCFKDDNKMAAKLHSIFSKILFWNAIIRLIFEGYLEIGISVLIGVSDIEWSGPNNNSSVLYSNLFTVALLLAFLALPLFFITYYVYNASKFYDDEEEF